MFVKSDFALILYIKNVIQHSCSFFLSAICVYLEVYDKNFKSSKMDLTDFVLLNAGGIFIANNKERLDEYKRLGTIAKPFGIETYVLSPEETKKLYPLMNVDDIYGTLYSPGDGTIDPNGLCQALTRSATRAGCKVSLVSCLNSKVLNNIYVPKC